MNKRIFFGGAILVAGVMLLQGGCATMPEATGAGNDKNAGEVRAVLDAQVAAWNRGDIEEFMKGYERAETIVFVSGDNITRGWQTVMDRYKKNYDSREKMGTLAFSELEIKPLSPFTRRRRALATDARRRRPARSLHAHLPPRRRGLAHRPRPHFIGAVSSSSSSKFKV